MSVISLRLLCGRLIKLIIAVMLVGAMMPPRDANACACCGSFKVINVEQGDVLNVRTGPGTGYKIVYGLQPGEGCIIKTGKKRGKWVAISYGDVKGWVHGRYLGYIK